jgi:hypothetical protein
MQKDSVAMVLEEPSLGAREASNVCPSIRRNSHPSQGVGMSNRRDEKPAVSFERNETAIEEMIDRRCQEEPVFTVQAFLVR